MASILSEQRLSGLPIVDVEGHVLGVVSEADILLKERGAKRRRGGLLGWLQERRAADLTAKLEARTAGEAMTSPAITITGERSLSEAAVMRAAGLEASDRRVDLEALERCQRATNYLSAAQISLLC